MPSGSINSQLASARTGAAQDTATHTKGRPRSCYGRRGRYTQTAGSVPVQRLHVTSVALTAEFTLRHIQALCLDESLQKQKALTEKFVQL